MAFKKEKKQPDFSVLKKTLAQSGNKLDNATYQTIQQLIDKLMQFQTVDAEEKTAIQGDVTNISNSTTTVITGIATSSYLTVNDETASLPNSVRLAAGIGVSFDDSVSGVRTVNVIGGGSGSGYWAPLTDGDLIETDLIFAGGECVMIFVPTP